MPLTQIDVKTIELNPFTLMDEDWMLITAGDAQACNTMTASWGGLGELWNEDVATIYVRPQRYTKTFLDAKDTFSCCFFDERFREMMRYCGRVSGRDEDKIQKAGLHVLYDEADTPYFEEARMVLLCQKIYCAPLDPKGIVVPAYDQNYYADQDYHTMYVGKVQKVLMQELQI